MSPSAHSLLPELGADPVAAVRAGLPTAALDRLQTPLQVSDARLASLLGVSPRTLRRRRESGTLTPDESDRIMPPVPQRLQGLCPHVLIGQEFHEDEAVT